MEKSRNMSCMVRIVDQARMAPRRIVLPEGNDPRILQAATHAHRMGVTRTTLLGTQLDIEKMAHRESIDLSDIEIINPRQSQYTERYADRFG